MNITVFVDDVKGTQSLIKEIYKNELSRFFNYQTSFNKRTGIATFIATYEDLIIVIAPYKNKH